MLYMSDNLVQYPSRKHAEYADDDAQHRYKRSPDRNTSTGIDDVEHFWLSGILSCSEMTLN